VPNTQRSSHQFLFKVELPPQDLNAQLPGKQLKPKPYLGIYTSTASLNAPKQAQQFQVLSPRTMQSPRTLQPDQLKPLESKVIQKLKAKWH
jgi:hypothetical protein